MKKRFVILFLFFARQIASYEQEHRTSVYEVNAFDGLDLAIVRSYPVSLSDDRVRCLIVPAGHDEQAQLLRAATYKGLQHQDFTTIILLCANQTTPFYGLALPLYSCADFSQILLPEHEVIPSLLSCNFVHYFDMPFCNHRSLSEHMKCICFYLKNPTIIPIIMGELSIHDASRMAVILAGCVTDKTLIVMSANIGEYQNCIPYNLADASKICMVYDHDAAVVQMLQEDPKNRFADIFDDQFASSIFALFFQLVGLPDFKNKQSLFVGYTTSSDGSHIMEDISTYGSFIIQDWAQGYKNNIGYYEQNQLLQLARQGLYELFNDPVCRAPCMFSYEMMQPCGLFASLYRMSDHGPLLQGCMGKVQAKLPLHKMAYHMTQQAACKDVRFYPVRHKDIDTTIISLSVIKDFKRITKYDHILSTDGLMLQYDDKKAICLPEARPLVEWNYQAALIDLSRQLGRNNFIWKKPRAKVFTFQVGCFQEE